MEQYVPYLALLIVAIGLGGLTLWMIIKEERHSDESRQRAKGE